MNRPTLTTQGVFDFEALGEQFVSRSRELSDLSPDDANLATGLECLRLDVFGPEVKATLKPATEKIGDLLLFRSLEGGRSVSAQVEYDARIAEINTRCSTAIDNGFSPAIANSVAEAKKRIAFLNFRDAHASSVSAPTVAGQILDTFVTRRNQILGSESPKI
jgi:hypothetical protein